MIKFSFLKKMPLINSKCLPMFWTKLVCTLLISVFWLALNAGSALGAEKPGKIFALYTFGQNDDAVRILDTMERGKKLQRGNYNIRAIIAPKRRERPIIFNSLDLKWAPAINIPSEKNRDDLPASQDPFFWTPGKNTVPIIIPLTLKASDKNTPVTEFDELHLDYQDIFSPKPHSYFHTDSYFPKR